MASMTTAEYLTFPVSLIPLIQKKVPFEALLQKQSSSPSQRGSVEKVS